jgi:hypothetical protein
LATDAITSALNQRFGEENAPVILFGTGVAAGSYATVSSPADIAPTPSLLLKVEKLSNAVGRILTEVIKDQLWQFTQSF